MYAFVCFSNSKQNKIIDDFKIETYLVLENITDLNYRLMISKNRFGLHLSICNREGSILFIFIY